MIWLGFDMEEDTVMRLVIDYLEFSYDEFYEWLESHKEIEGTEAEYILHLLKKWHTEKNK